MKRHVILMAIILGVALNLSAQSDSTTFVNGPWHSDSLDGLALRQCRFEGKQLFESNQQVMLLELPAASDYALQFAYRPQRTKTSVMAQEQGAVAAVNGSFFNMDEDYPVCYLRIGGVTFSDNAPIEDTLNRKYFQFGTLCMDRDSVFILKADTVAHWEDSLPYPDLMTARPLLVFDGERVPLREDQSFNTTRHNRVAAGIRPDGTVLLVVVDGRAEEAQGMSLFELQKVMCWLGCRDALNLDGGGSTTMYSTFGTTQGVVNCPSDNGRFDHEGERTVSNVVLVQKRRSPR